MTETATEPAAATAEAERPEVMQEQPVELATLPPSPPQPAQIPEEAASKETPAPEQPPEEAAAEEERPPPPQLPQEEGKEASAPPEAAAAEGEEPPPPPPPLPGSDDDAEALRLKTLAEDRYRSGSLKSALKYAKRAFRLVPSAAAGDGLPQMVTALRVLRAPPSDHYRALLLEPFSHVNAVRHQYKSLALALHPDKNAASLSAFPGLEDAFKRVGEAFQVLSDRIRRKEYDLKLRVELEAAAKSRAEAAAAAVAVVPVETFWTACTKCRLFHQFDRRYVGQRLLCPRCKKSFLAVEVRIDGGEEDVAGDGGGDSDAAGDRVRDGPFRPARACRSSRSSSRPSALTSRAAVMVDQKRKARVLGSPETSRPKKAREKTLAEMQLEARRKSKSNSDLSVSVVKEKGREKRRSMVPRSEDGVDLSLMAVEDSDFYDFDKDRGEKCFRKGQIWAIYDDDDGMPRHYGQINEVFSTNPFKVNMSWLDIQNNGDDALVLWEKLGFHISCGRFKVGRKVDIDSVNFFSHAMECERAARELYRIYPKKGSIWALYSEGTLGGDQGRCYDIVLFLTSYSERHGLSMAYLDKVEGFKTIFKRREIGVHAIKWLEKENARLFSHLIPAWKLSGSELPGLPKECWELDPASLPPELLSIGWEG